MAVVTGPLATLVLLGAFVSTIVVESRDAPGLLDDTEVVQVVGEECELMTSTVEGLTLSGPPADRARTLRDQNEAVRQMLQEIRALDDLADRDQPLQAWLEDWDRLVEAREAYAEEVAGGREIDLSVPRDDDGNEITERMDGAGLLVCEVPEALVTPEFGDSREV